MSSSSDDVNFIGEGTYGQVYMRDGVAVKKFSSLSHIIQEYMALRYLRDCNYVVHCLAVDFMNLELTMELYDESLRSWLKRNIHRTLEDVLPFIRDVCIGLIELHDRKLAHGDLKPSNILVRSNPSHAVLGDCGFVSVESYAKVDRTAPIYLEENITHSTAHDMYSLGICLLEIFGSLKVQYRATYSQLAPEIDNHIDNPIHRSLIKDLCHSDPDKRPTAREVLAILFDQRVGPLLTPLLSGETSNRPVKDEKNEVRKFMKFYGHKYKINRVKKGYGALIHYVRRTKLAEVYHIPYAAVILMILSSVFGKSGFRLKQIQEILKAHKVVNLEMIHEALVKLTSNDDFINIIMFPYSG